MFVNNVFSQDIFLNINQNRTYNADAQKNVMFFVGQNETISITANLNMLTFKKSDDSAYYGYDLGDGNNYQSIPSNWDFEIINLPTPEGSNLSADKKSFTYSGDTNNTYSVRIRIFDKSTNTTINNLSNVQLTYYIRDNFTVANAFWNSCDEKYVLSVNEAITAEGTKACSPYSIKVWGLEIDGSGNLVKGAVVYENTQESNTWALDLDVGEYVAEIKNSCGQTVNNGNYLFSITSAYKFDYDILFNGFKCFDDDSGSVSIKVIGARINEDGPFAGLIEWYIKDSSGTIIRGNSNGNVDNSSSYISQGATWDGTGDSPFDYGNLNFTIEIVGLAEGTYEFFFKDANGCSKTANITVAKSCLLYTSPSPRDS